MRAPDGAICRWVCANCGYQRNGILRTRCRICGADRTFKASAR